MSAQPGSSLRIGDRFEIADREQDLLGHGGMGDVYRGIDAQTGGTVAIKVLKPEIMASNPDLAARFVREGEALRRLDHPNIVKMIAAIEEGGQHYLAIEYVEGGSLRDLLEEQDRLSVERTVEIALDLADALTRAHRLGIIHRDLKPANVLLAKDGTPRLTDFGVAHVAGVPQLTHTGMVVGTVEYLSPEACNGEKLDARADIWAFGAILYEMLTGARPFTGETVTEVLLKIVSQPLPDLTALRADVPLPLADLVRSMLEKDREARIPSVRLVGAELERFGSTARFLSGVTPAWSDGWSGISDVQLEPAYSAPVTQGLDVLTDLMRTSEVRDSVVLFRADLQVACEQIETLDKYKHLHDLLHTLQFHGYNPIVQESKRFPDDDVAVDNLIEYEFTLQRILNELQDAIAQASFAEAETLWIQDLVKAHGSLSEAIEGLDPKQLRRAIWLLNRVLAVQPAQINTRLNAAARALRLSALVEAMSSIRDKLPDFRLDSEKVEQFREGVDALTELSERLVPLVDTHDRWQVVDLDMRRIESSLDADTMDLEMSWPDLQAMVEPLYAGSSEEWARSFERDSDRLDSAISAGNPDRVRRAFRRYRRQADVRFYQVDLELKRLCEDLRRVGEPLSLVMKEIG